jgi:hypothetical protein
MPADEGDSFIRGDAVDHRQARQGGPGPPATARARNLDPFGRGALPRLGKHGQDLIALAGQA